MRDEARAEPLVQGEASPLGLTSAQARGLIHQFGPNELRPKRPLSFAAELGRRLRNPLVAILLAASLVSAFTGDIASFVIILVIVVLSVAIDFVQEHRASRAAQALVHRVQVHALVMRDGRLAPIPVARLVPGDVVQLSPGSLVPADGRLLESNALHVNESMLTGEPFPVEKGAAGPGGASELFMGTSAVSGSGTMLVTRTGPSTEIGKIALSLAAVAPPTSFERGIHAFGMLIMRLTAFMVLFVLLVNAALHRPLLESFLFAIALAVGLTPELLPMIVSVTLARGALRLADEHVIVKRLGAIEGLGSMDVLCTDKTGTLTRAHIRLESHIDGDGRDSPRVLELAYLNSHFAAGVRNPLDAAILERPALDPGRWKKLAEIPFDFERRRVAVVLESAGERMLVVKGAPEDLLKLSTRYETAGDKTAREWTPDARARAVRSLEALGESGLRALGVAYKPLQGGAGRAADEQDLVFVGFAAFIDPPKPQAAAALAALAASGIRLKILTGDGEAVTRHLCAQIGLEVDGALTGEQIERMDDPALAARVEAATIFCRVTPAQKNRIVLMLKARGHVTGFLGDGINDATALHSADVSLSVNNAVDVAKEAADLILLRRDLGVVHRGVLEGRRTFANIRKYLLMGTSSNFGNMFSMAGAAIFLPFLPMLPAQILLNNLLYDFSEIPIPLDHADAAETARPQKWDMVLVRDFMWTLGPVSSLFDFLTFYVLIALLQADEALFQTGWFIESLATQVLVIFVIRTRASPFASRPALTLVATSLAVVAIAVALPYTPAAAYLGFEPPPAHFFTVLAGLTLAYLALAELVKRRFYAARS
ncbi:MAG: magnesium-translocating P-type ATPase [Usitatibacter sp.]